VGSRRDGRGRVIVQTRRHDEVIDAAVRGDVMGVIHDDVVIARELGLAPFGARARVSGEAAAAFAAALGAEVRVRRVGEEFDVRASDVTTLTSALRAVTRPAGRLRLEVD